MNITIGGVGKQSPLAAHNVMKQVMIADEGAERVEWSTLFPAILVWLKIKKILIGKNRMDMSAHSFHLLFS